MVGAPTQALVAQQLGMDNYIISRQQLTQEKMGWKQKILADLMEAFIAALFIGKNNLNGLVQTPECTGQGCRWSGVLRIFISG